MIRLSDMPAAAGCALLLALAGCAAAPAGTQTAANVCIQTYAIDHTSIPDDSTILFHMKGGKIWQNSLPYRCPELKFQGGFQYTTDINEICSNLQTIRVIEQGGGGPRFGATCQLGAFTPYAPPPRPGG